MPRKEAEGVCGGVCVAGSGEGGRRAGYHKLHPTAAPHLLLLLLPPCCCCHPAAGVLAYWRGSPRPLSCDVVNSKLCTHCKWATLMLLPHQTMPLAVSAQVDLTATRGQGKGQHEGGDPEREGRVTGGDEERGAEGTRVVLCVMTSRLLPRL